MSLPVVGYKYIWFDVDTPNWDVYMQSIETGTPVHHADLRNEQGREDNEHLPGVYFCRTLGDLNIWLKECFDWLDPAGIEILEVTPMGLVRERVYADGRIAYIAEACTCRIVDDKELPQDMLNMIEVHFA